MSARWGSFPAGAPENAGGKQEGIPEEQRKNAEMNFEEFREEAKRRKKRIENAEDRRAFRDWLFDQERKFEKICVI